MILYDYQGNAIEIGGGSAEERNAAFLLNIGSGQGIQGSCTDGEYIYSADESNTVYKYGIVDGKFRKVTSSYTLDHANDMTYNPNTGKVYIATMDTSANIAIVDPATLEVEQLFVLRNSDNSIHRCYGLCYDRVNDQYITADTATEGKKYSFFTSGFAYIKTITITRNETYTLQGIETDGTYIYRALWNDSNNKNYVYIHDMDMNYISHIEVPQTGELEAISCDWKGNWYATYHNGSVYFLGLFNDSTYEKQKQFHDILNAYEPSKSIGYVRNYTDITDSITFERKEIATSGITDSTTHLLAKLPCNGNVEVRFYCGDGKFAVFKKAGSTITLLKDYSFFTYEYTGDDTSEYYACIIHREDFSSQAITEYKGSVICHFFTYEDVGVNYSDHVSPTLIGKKVAFIGDSITQGRYKNLYVNANREVLKPYPNLISERVGCQTANYGVGGGLIYDSNSLSISRACTAVTGYDVVVLCGGTNDYGNNTSSADFTTAFQYVLDTLTANNTKVIVATPTVRPNKTNRNSAGLYLSDYCTIEKNLAMAMDLDIIDLNVLTNNDAFKATLNDGLHPNEFGHRILANLILANA